MKLPRDKGSLFQSIVNILLQPIEIVIANAERIRSFVLRFLIFVIDQETSKYTIYISNATRVNQYPLLLKCKMFSFKSRSYINMQVEKIKMVGNNCPRNFL